MRRRPFDLVDQPMQIQIDNLGQSDEFDKIEPALTRFDVRDEGLMFAEVRRDLGLRQPGPLAGFGNLLDQELLARTADCFGHLPAEVALGQLPANPKIGLSNF